MEDDKIELIKKLIQEKNGRHQTRRALVSAGYGTDDFNALYDTALAQLGVSEPKGEMSNMLATGESTIYRNDPYAHGMPRLIHNLKVTFVFLVLFCAVVVGGYLLFSYISMPRISDGPIMWGKAVTKKDATETLGFSDTVLQTKVKATVASAIIYGSRMGGYDGVCRDITVVAPVVCRETPQALFVIYAPLSDGTYSCEDKAEKPVVVVKKPQYGESCI